jgi:hypothetical protein
MTSGKTLAGPVRLKSKAQLRLELEQATLRFLRGGGEVQEVPTGVSYWQPGDTPAPSQMLFNQPRQPRTPVPEVVAALEARRRSGSPPPGQTRKRRQPRQRTIYDDFGEPLRRVWDNDD